MNKGKYNQGSVAKLIIGSALFLILLPIIGFDNLLLAFIVLSVAVYLIVNGAMNLKVQQPDEEALRLNHPAEQPPVRESTGTHLATSDNTTVSNPISSEDRYAKELIRLSGVSYEGALENILKYVNEELEIKDKEDLWGGYTNKEIKDGFEEKYYELDDLAIYDEITFQKEPDNPHDKNAISVRANGNHIGYIPKNETKRIWEMLEDGWHPNITRIVGGRFKYLDYDSDKVRIDRDNYGVHIEMIKDKLYPETQHYIHRDELKFVFK